MILRQLHQFLAVIDCGSVGRAARQLGLSQPALTKYIRSLERTLGAPLFTRSYEGMALNQFGRSLEPRARSITIEVERAEREIREILGAERGRIVVGTSPSFASAVLVPHVLPAFRASHPHVQLVLIEGFLEAAAARVASGEMDFAIGTLPFDFVHDDLASEVLLPRERVMLVAGRDNPIAARRRVPLAEVQPGPWLLPRGSGLRARINEVFVTRGLAAPEAAFMYEALSLAKDLLNQGPFIAALSVSAVEVELNAGTLRVVRVPEFVLERSISLLYRPDPSLGPAAKLLFDRIRAASALVLRRARRKGPPPSIARIDARPRVTHPHRKARTSSAVKARTR